MGIAHSLTCASFLGASAQIGCVAVEAVYHLASGHHVGALWKVCGTHGHRMAALGVELLVVSSGLRVVLIECVLPIACILGRGVPSVTTVDVSHLTLALLLHALEVARHATLAVVVIEVSARSLVSALLLALLELDLLDLSQNLSLSLSSVHALAYKDVHEHDLLLLRTQIRKTSLALTNSLARLPLYLHLVILVFR